MPPTQRPYHEASQDTFSYKLFPGSFTGHCQLQTLTTKLHRAPLAANSWRVASRDASSCTPRLSPQGSQEAVRWPGKAQGWLCSPPAPRLSLRCNPPSCFVKHEPCPSAPHTGRAPKPVSPLTHLSGRPGSLLTPRAEGGRPGAERGSPACPLSPASPLSPLSPAAGPPRTAGPPAAPRGRAAPAPSPFSPSAPQVGSRLTCGVPPGGAADEEPGEAAGGQPGSRRPPHAPAERPR